MKNCMTNYNDTIRQDPRAYCKAGQDLSTCVGQAYKTLDRCTNNNVQWWACERIDRRVKLEGYCDANNVSKFWILCEKFEFPEKLTFLVRQRFCSRATDPRSI
jgi:hypothetical protein